MKEFNPTHTFHYSVTSPLFKMFPKGIPVVKGQTDDSGLIEWLADGEGNVGGYSTEGDSFVRPIK